MLMNAQPEGSKFEQTPPNPQAVVGAAEPSQFAPQDAFDGAHLPILELDGSMPSDQAQAEPSVGSKYGFAQHFESRPEYLFGRHVLVVNAAPGVKERVVDDILVVKIADVFASQNETFMGFGRPNTYLVIPGDAGQYDKFSGKSFRRGPAEIVNTKGWIQSGALIRFEHLPDEARIALSGATRALAGKKFLTCVNACATALETAGFTSGAKPLSKYYRPVSLLRALNDQGLNFKAQPIQLKIVRTAPITFEGYSMRIFLAEALTFYRHFIRAIKPILEKSVVGKKLYRRLSTPVRFENADKVIAPELPSSRKYLSDLKIQASHPIKIGRILRLFCGPHTLFEVKQDRIKIDDYLPNALKAFPNPNPSAFSILKQRLLFSRPVVAIIHAAFFARFESLGEHSEDEIYDMLRTHAPNQNNRYNLVINADQVLVARTRIKTPLADWILSKHVLMSGYNPEVRFAGEMWKDASGTLWIGPNSGTYCPDEQQLNAAVAYMQAIFPNLEIKKTPYDKTR